MNAGSKPVCCSRTWPLQMDRDARRTNVRSLRLHHEGNLDQRSRGEHNLTVAERETQTASAFDGPEP